MIEFSCNWGVGECSILYSSAGPSFVHDHYNINRKKKIRVISVFQPAALPHHKNMD